MTDSIKQLIEEFNQEISDCETYDFLTRDDGLQRQACSKLEVLWEKARTLKEEYRSNKEENSANIFLGYQCALSHLFNKLNMWVLLKNDEPDKAWEHLVKAQYQCLDAIRSHEGFQHLSVTYKYLIAIEKLIYPPQVFLSSGFLVGEQVCSVCNDDYDDCAHVVGRVYNGTLCKTLLRNITVDHVAIVKQPADKRCRITSFETKEGGRNRMTWKLEPISEDSAPGSKGAMTTNTIPMVADDENETI